MYNTVLVYRIILNMLTIQEIRNRLSVANLTKVAKLCGISRSALINMKQGKDVSYRTVKKVSDFYENLDKRGD